MFDDLFTPCSDPTLKGIHWFTKDGKHLFSPRDFFLLRYHDYVYCVDEWPGGNESRAFAVTDRFICFARAQYVSDSTTNQFTLASSRILRMCENNLRQKPHFPGLGEWFLRQFDPTKVVTDTEYNDKPLPSFDIESVAPLISDYLPSETPDETLYQNFKLNMDAAVSTKLGERSGHMSIPIDVPSVNRDTTCFRTYAQRLPIKTVRPLPPFITIFPKITTVTSDGKIRLVFPQSSSLQEFLEQNVGNLQPRVPYPIVSGLEFHKQAGLKRGFFSYDVRSCDKNVWPYYVRYIRETRPHQMEYFIPRVVISLPKKRMVLTGYYPQFPSGMYGLTSAVTASFTSAILMTIGVPTDSAWIQGDGIASNIPLQHPLLRQSPSGQINGFCYNEGVPRYLRAREKLEASRRKTRGCNGNHRWHLRYYIYKDLLNAVDMPPVRNPTLYDFYRRLGVNRCLDLLRSDPQGDSYILENFQLEQDRNNVDALPHSMYQMGRAR